MTYKEYLIMTISEQQELTDKVLNDGEYKGMTLDKSTNSIVQLYKYQDNFYKVNHNGILNIY